VKCWYCQADGNGAALHYAKATDDAPDHPIRVAEKAERKSQARAEKIGKSRKKLDDALRGVRGDDKQRRLKLAAESEKRTNKALQRSAEKAFARHAARSADGNSGRVANDDDHVLLGGEIRFDTKNYSTKVHPPIELDQYDECKAKANKHGSDAFGLVIYNKAGRAFIVFDFEQDWPHIQEKLNLTLLRTEE
jgi:hypothetical protein